MVVPTLAVDMVAVARSVVATTMVWMAAAAAAVALGAVTEAEGTAIVKVKTELWVALVAARGLGKEEGTGVAGDEAVEAAEAEAL